MYNSIRIDVFCIYACLGCKEKNKMFYLEADFSFNLTDF